MRIGELAKKASVSRDTIRLYERQGLIQSEPGLADTNDYRDYPDDCVLTLELIREAKDAGMTLADITVLLAQLSAQTANDFDGMAFLDAKIAEVELRLTRSAAFLQTLKDTRNALARAPFPDED